MQNTANKNKRKGAKKRELVYAPYQRGDWHDKTAVRRGLSILTYYLVFAFLYVLLGATLQFDNAILRVAGNLVLVLACAMLLYMNGARDGEADTALGEIALTRAKTGKAVSPEDARRCFHPAKGFFVMGVGVALLLMLSISNALTAQKQVYTLQSLPTWVSAYGEQEEIALPLAYYRREVAFGVLDVIRLIVRVLVFPFANIATADNADAMLLVDRLSPLLVMLPALGYPLGYLSGPRARAMVHGDINNHEKRRQRRNRKADRAKKERLEKKNEII